MTTYFKTLITLDNDDTHLVGVITQDHGDAQANADDLLDGKYLGQAIVAEIDAILSRFTAGIGGGK